MKTNSKQKCRVISRIPFIFVIGRLWGELNNKTEQIKCWCFSGVQQPIRLTGENCQTM